MLVSLSAQSERIIPYCCFDDRPVVEIMPKLAKAGYYPAGVALLTSRRQNAPEEVRIHFNRCFWTGDGAVADQEGGILFNLDCKLIRSITPKNPSLIDGALKIEHKLWRQLKKDNQKSLYLSPLEVEAANGKGYVLNEDDGIFVAEDPAVEKAWNFLKRGENIQEYAQKVRKASNSNKIMKLQFNRTRPEYPLLRPLVLESLGYGSVISSSGSFVYRNSRIVGVAPPEARMAKELIEIVKDYGIEDPETVSKALRSYLADNE